MNYEETIAYIHNAYWVGTKTGLSRTKELLALLGNPQDKLKFVHVAGTNGKGSICAMTASVLTAAGYKTGLYTSPFVNRFNERIAINGKPIGDEALVKLFALIQPTVEGMKEKPSEFELITCAAMLYYLQENCDIVVLEVGMGGEWDSTNVIRTPELSIIAAMGYDHMKYLGNTMAEIASAKAGIIKPNGDTVIYGENPEANAVFERACSACGNNLIKTDFSRIKEDKRSLEGHVFTFGPYKELHLPLIGPHQTKNAAVVLTALEKLSEKGWKIPAEAVYEGLSAVVWPARMELLKREPVLLLDGGHNPHGFTAAAATLRDLFPDKKITFLMGVMADKDYTSMINLLLPLADHFLTVTPDNPRALQDELLTQRIESLGGTACSCGSVEKGVDKLLNEAKKEDVLCAIGSLYMAGDVRRLVLEREKNA